VGADVKFCGLVREEDARQAAMCGVRYAGVVFAESPRRVSAEQGARVLDAAGRDVARVGVFADADAEAIAGAVRAARLEIVQLHGDPSAREVRAVRAATGARIWAVLRLTGAAPAERVAELDGEADGIVFEAYVPGRLGGTGRRFDWEAAAAGARPRVSPLIVAGGLTPENVAVAIAALAPDVVDVSSGVEVRPGVKDHDRMRAFADAVRLARVAR